MVGLYDIMVGVFWMVGVYNIMVGVCMNGESIHDMTPEKELGESFRPLFLCGRQALLELLLHEGSVVRPPGVNRGNDVCGEVEGGDQLLNGTQLLGKVQLGQVDSHPDVERAFLGGD